MQHRDDIPPQPYQSPQNFTPPPLRPKPKRSKKVLWIGLGVLGVLIVISALTNHGKNAPGQNAASTDTATSTQAATPLTSYSLDPSPVTNASDVLAVGAPPVTRTALSISGTAIKKTKTFTVGDEWSIKYSFDCANFGSQGNFQVYVYVSDGSLVDTPVNVLATKGSDTTYEHASPGTFYLEINSECDWQVTVTDGDSGQ